jgi:hypothetical protein
VAPWGVEVIRLMVDAAHDDGSGEEHVHEGVSFQAWAFVLAGLGDGLALEDLLAHLGLDEERWEPASAAFQETLLDDVELGGTLSEALDEAMRDARRSWIRPIPPLDVELRAWLDFYRAWASDEAPMAFLLTRGLRAADIHRLQEHWMAQIAGDQALREKALEILETPAGPVPEPRPGPPRLATGLAEQAPGPDITAAKAGRSVACTLPFTAGEPAPAHPRLSVPLPPAERVARRIGAEETRVAARVEAAVAALPFSPPVDEASEESTPFLPPELSEALPALAPPVARDKSGEPEPDAGPDGSPMDFTVERYAALCVDLIESAGNNNNEVLTEYGITAAQKRALDEYWTQKMTHDTTTWLAWDRACAERKTALRLPSVDVGPP